MLTHVHHCVKSVQIRNFFWSIFSPNAGKYGPEKLCIWALFTQCKYANRSKEEGLRGIIVCFYKCSLWTAQHQEKIKKQTSTCKDSHQRQTSFIYSFRILLIFSTVWGPLSKSCPECPNLMNVVHQQLDTFWKSFLLTIKGTHFYKRLGSW